MGVPDTVMFYVILFIALFGQFNVLFAAEAPPASAGVTLRQCYDWAKDRNENLKIRYEDIQQSKARARAALGSALPYLHWDWMETWQDPDGVEALNRKGFSGFVEKEQIESKFTLEQPLFSGLREFSASAGFKRESARDQLLFERANQELFQEIAEAFYDVVGYETDQHNTAAAYKLAQDRVKDLNSFLKLGKARKSELYTANAHAAALKGRLDRIQADLNTARALLSYLTGHDLSAADVTDEAPRATLNGNLESFLAKANDRTDLRAQREDVQAKRLRVRYERGSFWPDADVKGNYYTKRATFLKDIDWDVILSLNVPIYQGGTISANVREAASAYRQSALTLDQMERYVSYSIRKLYGELQGAIQEEVSLSEALQSARQSYDALRREYDLGLVTNLDVLQALDFLREQQSAYDSARLNAKRLVVQLNVAIEDYP
jgi:outer membrane protein